MIFNMTGGAGSSATLNFKVVGGTTKPVSPSENMIWVNTNAEVTGYTFSMTEPENPTEGIVWIATASSSVVSFSATKKNSIMVYPVSVKQYVDGTWVDKTATTYQDGAWVNWWAGELYSYGDECEYVTGGWITDEVSFITDVTAVEPRITKNGNSVTIDIAQSGAYGGVYRTNNKISFQGKKSLVFTGTAKGDSTDRCAIMIWSEMNRDFTVGRVATYQFNNSFSGDATIDVSSLDGEYYIGIHVYNYSTSSVTMQEMKLV